MKATWLGHAAFLLEDDDRVLIDPFLTGNPAAATTAEEAVADLICVTHAHGDHYGDAEAISRRTQAPLVGIFEITSRAAARGIETTGLNIGGSTTVKHTRLTMTPAVHSSCFVGDGVVEAGGNPAGFVMAGDHAVYHAGDTAVFGDMALIGELSAPDLALLPIGDFYTMGPTAAVKAVELLGVKRVVPMHFNTFDVIRQDPVAFKAQVERKTAAKVTVLRPGESLTLD